MRIENTWSFLFFRVMGEKDASGIEGNQIAKNLMLLSVPLHYFGSFTRTKLSNKMKQKYSFQRNCETALV